MGEFKWNFLINSVDFLLYGVLFASISFLLYVFIADDIKIRSAHYKYRFQLKRKQLKNGEKKIPQQIWFQHLYRLFAVRSVKHDAVTVYAFIAIEIFIGVSVFVLMLLRLEDAVLGLSIAVLSMLMPYLFLFMSARNIRNEIGSDLDNIVQTLLHSYSSSSSHMYTALNRTQEQLKNKKSKLVFARLISKLQTAHDEQSIRETMDVFIFSTKNSWGLRLGNIIMKSYLHHEKVTKALLTLQQQMIDHKKMMEEEKADAEKLSMTGIFVVIGFPVSLILGKFITTPQDWMKLQFGHPMAFLCFTVTLIFVILSGLISYIVKKPKNEL